MKEALISLLYFCIIRIKMVLIGVKIMEYKRSRVLLRGNEGKLRISSIFKSDKNLIKGGRESEIFLYNSLIICSLGIYLLDRIRA